MLGEDVVAAAPIPANGLDRWSTVHHSNWKPNMVNSPFPIESTGGADQLRRRVDRPA